MVFGIDNNNIPLLTIAIPTFNRAKILGKGLKALLPQILPYHELIEIIISDNCSPDNTWSVIERVKSDFNTLNIKINRNFENLGYYGNFKKCRELSTGKYLWLLSDNEHIKADFLIPFMKNMLDEKGPGIFYLEDCSKTTGLEICDQDFETMFNSSEAYKMTLISSVIFLNNKLNDRDIFHHLAENSFLGFLLLAGSLQQNRIIRCIRGNIFTSVPCYVSFNVFHSWTKDIFSCLDYYEKLKLITTHNKNIFINSILKEVIYFHTLNYLLDGHLYKMNFGNKYDLKHKLNFYYQQFEFYNHIILPLFNKTRFELLVVRFKRKIRNRMRSISIIVSNI